jgi:hypothetical protein
MSPECVWIDGFPSQALVVYGIVGAYEGARGGAKSNEVSAGCWAGWVRSWRELITFAEQGLICLDED